MATGPSHYEFFVHIDTTTIVVNLFHMDHLETRTYGMAPCLSLFYCTSFCHGPELSGWTGSGANEEAKGQFSPRATGPNTTSTIAVRSILAWQ